MFLAHRITSSRQATIATDRLAGLVLFVLAAGFMTVIMVGASIAPGYDMRSAAISDLGVLPSTALLFNASLVGVGALNAFGGYLLFRSHRSGRVLAVFLLAATGAVGAGMVPLDRGAWHGISALVAFLFFNLQPLAMARWVRGAMRPLSITAGVVGLAFVVLMVIGDAGNEAAFGAIGHGGTERMIVYPPMLWLIALGGYLMGRGSAETW